MAISENDKQKLFILMAKLNPTFKQRQVILNEEEDKLKEGIGNFHASFHERTGQNFKDANDAWTNGAFHIRYKMLTQLGIEDQLAQKYAEQYENTPWVEVKSVLGKSMNEDDKWIQKAVNPEHKGFCSPESKPTCTPARKALAKRFKKGIDEEYTESTSEELKIKAERIKAAIDELITGNDEEGILRTLYRLLVERKKTNGIPQPATTSEVTEVKVPQNDTYFETLSAALNAVRERVEKKGFTVDEDNMFTEFGTGGINYGETKKATIFLLKNGVLDKRRSVTIAIYRMDSGKYELTAYLN